MSGVLLSVVLGRGMNFALREKESGWCPFASMHRGDLAVTITSRFINLNPQNPAHL